MALVVSVRSGVGVDVLVGVSVCVAVADGVGVDVSVGVAVAEGDAVAVRVLVLVGVLVWAMTIAFASMGAGAEPAASVPPVLVAAFPSVIASLGGVGSATVSDTASAAAVWLLCSVEGGRLRSVQSMSAATTTTSSIPNATCQRVLTFLVGGSAAGCGSDSP